MSKKTRKIINILLVAALVIGLSLFGRSVVEKKRAERRYNDVKTIVMHDDTPLDDTSSGTDSTADTSSPEESGDKVRTPDYYIDELLKIDLGALIEIAPEVKGWIYIPDTVIDYPIMQHSDNDYYLKHTWDGEPNKVGSIFFDSQNATDFSDFNTIIYGHNMNNGSMFGVLDRYFYGTFLEDHPSIYIVTEDGVFKYDIFAAHRTEVTTISFGMKIYTEAMQEEYLSFALDYSEIETDIVPTIEDDFLTLATCAYGNKYRIVIQAILDEDASYIRD